jgi:hypothetical protein
MSISKKIRFEVFKRDGFQCAYCGKTPPEVILEVDHIDPKSKGGKDDINNYITACFDCNRGKRDIPLDKIPNKLNDNLEILKEKEQQLKEYRKFVLKIRNRLEQDINKIQEQFQTYFPDRQFTDSFRLSIKNFLHALDIYDLIDFMDIACLKINNPSEALKYFCGICWNTIKENKNGG